MLIIIMNLDLFDICVHYKTVVLYLTSWYIDIISRILHNIYYHKVILFKHTPRVRSSSVRTMPHVTCIILQLQLVSEYKRGRHFGISCIIDVQM